MDTSAIYIVRYHRINYIDVQCYRSRKAPMSNITTRGNFLNEDLTWKKNANIENKNIKKKTTSPNRISVI